ncbi:hypothetical protein RSOLAG1IB_09087 [Rhizoctonia solani AG-1 IB]|uniref:Uncharacterized protein n=1 Tax=Thanatephorus cucumeris (strain AG1-IB / isolate 7/3/14) TaxID=1108050 RepID=A0A0B7FQB5_THACB|nr:hypothetical protein RSOLAG1IB_09087 [Rhizoctonia solani AG-1 IB]
MYLYDEGPGQSGDRVRKLKLEPPTEEQEPTDSLGGREAEALISGICKKGKTITPESSGNLPHRPQEINSSIEFTRLDSSTCAQETFITRNRAGIICKKPVERTPKRESD